MSSFNELRSIDTLGLLASISLPLSYCDLSGHQPFEVVVNIARIQLGASPEKYATPVSILAKKSVFDVMNALRSGLLRIVPGKGEPAEITVISSPPQNDELWDATVMIGPGPLVSKRRPLTVASVIDVTRLDGLEPGSLYEFKLGSVKLSADRFWNAGIGWWEYCPESRHDDALVEAEHTSPVVRVSLSPNIFKAMARVPDPPQLRYHLGTDGSCISLSNPKDLRIAVDFELKEPRAYTIYSLRLYDLPRCTVFDDSLTAFVFDVVNVNTGEVIFHEPSGNMGCTLGDVPPGPELERRRFKELEPGLGYHRELICRAEDQTKTLAQGLRLRRPELLIGRRLALKLRPTETWWKQGTIDELFRGRKKINVGRYSPPLTIVSNAYTEFRIVH